MELKNLKQKIKKQTVMGETRGAR